MGRGTKKVENHCTIIVEPHFASSMTFLPGKWIVVKTINLEKT